MKKIIGYINVAVLAIICFPFNVLSQNTTDYRGLNRQDVYKFTEGSKEYEVTSKAVAAYNEGRKYQYGLDGVAKDETIAFVYFKIADDMGLVQGQFAVAYCYRYGIGVERNDSLAFKGFMAVLDRGYKRALLSVGNCYFEGTGVKTDTLMAIK
ncbi:MAG: tetratricopeptide repeat protein, partial [Bacteroidales bacterium]